MAVMLKLHFSSIGIWSSIYPDVPDHTTVLGSPKGIRFDEWAMLTPLALSQVSHQLEAENPSAGGDSAPLLAGLPVNTISSWFRPQMWGYLLLPLEYAFSFFWIFKVVGLFLGLYLTFNVVTGGNRLGSVIGAIWVYLSGFVQWWFSTFTIEHMIGACFIIVAICKLATPISVKAKVIWSSILLFALCLYGLCLYPPTQIPLAYIIIAIIGFYMVREGGDSWRILLLNWRWWAGSFVIAAIVGAIHLTEAFPSIQTMLQTVYPGMRRDFGGGLSLSRYFFGMFDPVLSESRVAQLGGGWNVCEASSFLLLWPVTAILVYSSHLPSKIKFAYTIPLLTLLILTVWHIIGLPREIAQLLLLDRGYSGRMTAALGLGSCLVTMAFLCEERSHVLGVAGWKSRVRASLVTAIAALAIIWVAREAHTLAPALISPSWAMLLSLVVIYQVFFLSRQRLVPFVLLTLSIYAVPNLLVNPLARGLQAIEEKPIIKAIKEIDGRDRPPRAWMIFNDLYASNLAKASGAWIINGVQYIPNIKVFRTLDPEGRYQSIWNRFSHFGVARSENAAELKFVLQSNDSILLEIHPCAPVLRELGVQYFVFRSPATEAEAECLIPLRESLTPGFWIYERR
jgi:hypothetical protein